MNTVNQHECFMEKEKETIMHTLSSKRQTSKASETQYTVYLHMNTTGTFSMPQADRAQTKPAAWLMQSIVKQQPQRVIRQHCALYTIHICHLDNQQRLMTLCTVTMHSSPQQHYLL